MGGTVPPKIFPGPAAIGGSEGANVVEQAQALPGASALGSSVNTVNRAPVLPRPPALPAPIPRAPIPIPRTPIALGPRPAQLATGGPIAARLRLPVRESLY